MLMELLKIGALLIVLILPLFYPIKTKTSRIKMPKNYPDTSDAHYAVNERGFLEEIHHDNLSSHAH
jgi:hypothetical protein